MSTTGFGGDAASILNHPNIAKDLNKARNSKLVKSLKQRAHEN